MRITCNFGTIHLDVRGIDKDGDFVIEVEREKDSSVILYLRPEARDELLAALSREEAPDDRR